MPTALPTRRVRSLAVALMFAVSTTVGCVPLPEQDSTWARMATDSTESRMAYAEQRKNAGLAIGLVGAGIFTVGLIIYFAGLGQLVNCPTDTNDPDYDSCNDAALNTFLAGLVIFCVGVGPMVHGLQSAAKWGEAMQGGPIGEKFDTTPSPEQFQPPTQSQPTPKEFQPSRPAGDPGSSSSGGIARPVAPRLYVAANSRIPAGAVAGLEVVRLAGPTDPAAVRLAAQLPVLRLPLLEVPTADGRSELHVGAPAVAQALSRLVSAPAVR